MINYVLSLEFEQMLRGLGREGLREMGGGRGGMLDPTPDSQAAGRSCKHFPG